MNQHKAVLDHLRERGTITSMEAFEMYGATRLSAIIFDLRAKGHDIKTIMVDGKNRYGDTTRYAKYQLVQSVENML